MTLKAILVEDSKTIRDTLTSAMTELADMEVIAVADTAIEAKAVLARHGGDWQVAVVDLFLKQGSGLEVLSANQRRCAHQKIVVLTNYATADIRRNCMALGADAVFDKSTELDEFFDLCISLAQAAPR